jgi:hypothetical protein
VAKANKDTKNPKEISKMFKEKLLPMNIAKEVYWNNDEFYSDVEELIDIEKTQNIKASIKLMAACQYPQVSYTMTFSKNSIFTEQLLKVWDEGKFVGSYDEFFAVIKERVGSMDFLPTVQTPNLYSVGEENNDFDKQKPFQIYE